MGNADNLKPFQAGEDPRRQNGRKEGSKNRSTIVRELLESKVTRLNPLSNAEEEMTLEEGITASQINRALNGDTNAYKAVMDSAYGAPKQPVGGEGDDEPIKHSLSLTPETIEAFNQMFDNRYK